MPYDENGNWVNPSKKKPPAFIGESENYNQMMDWIINNLGGPEGLQDIVSQAQGAAGERVPFMSKLPWGEKQIGEWLTNQITGKGAEERGAKFTEGLKKDTASRYYKMAQDLKGGLARGGLGGSSAEARARSEGTAAYSQAQNVNALTGQQYTDELKQQAFERGMSGLGAYQSVARGDYSDAITQAQTLLQSLAPGLSAWGTGLDAAQGAAGLEAGQQGMENEFNLQQWLALLAKGGGGGLAKIIGQLLNAGGQVGAAAITAGA